MSLLAAVFVGSIALFTEENPYNLTVGGGRMEASSLSDVSREGGLLGACTSSVAWCPQASKCTDTFSGYKCTDLLGSYDCPTLVGMGGCKKCTCAPGTYDEKATPAPPRTGKCGAATSTPCYTDLAQWQIDNVLAKHNEFRAKHGACPLTYSTAIADWTIKSKGMTTTCTTEKLTHNKKSGYGENIAMVGGQTEVHDYDPASGTTSWYCGEEACWNYDTASETGTTGHMTQVVWKDSSEVGCALCHKKSGTSTNVYLMCNYKSPGNVTPMGPGSEYAKNVLKPNTAATGCKGSTSTDECAATPSPCGSDQTCNDPDQSSANNFVCTCKADTATKATGSKPASCTIDECTTTPCGTGQTCNDPDTAASKSHDFTCTCDNDSSIKKVDGPATCMKDECTTKPCGSSGQDCNDPNTSPGSTGDYTCTCTGTTSIVVKGGPATCTNDECQATPAPCGTGQTCNDPDTAANKLHDFTCACDNDNSIRKVDGPATCMKDECTTTPCGTGQTCNDPNTSPGSTGDYTCTCTGTTSIVVKGGPATCTNDECQATPTPCGTGQTCNDPDTAANKLHDFTCICDNDNSIRKVDGPATCMKDECTTTPCGTGQTCKDPNTSPGSTSDYTCTCTGSTSIVVTGGPATCTKDECKTTPAPCGQTGQTCNDPDTAANKLHDFTCTCDNDNSIRKVDGPATCTKDECASMPCATGQTCEDPNKSAAMLKDFVCTCPAPNTMTTNVGGPATCSTGSNDECASTPCPAGQTCTDPDKASAPSNDFVCTCTTGTGSATGKGASCVLDECNASPCGSGQTCSDPDTSVSKTKDYVCTCTAPKLGTMTGGAATCILNECDAKPCGTGQVCKDPNTALANSNDFTCTCTNGVVATGTSATCEIDECARTPSPCGGAASGQTCNDPNKAKNSQHDFTCTCDADTTIVKVDGPARCVKDECDAKPCGTGQVCKDPNTELKNLNDFTCTCTNGVVATGTSATCEIDECARTPSPCGGAASGQTCNDPNKAKNSQHDFTCTCDANTSIVKVDGPARCVKDECDAKPCGTGQTCKDLNTELKNLNDFTCTCTNGIVATGTSATCEIDECARTPSPCGGAASGQTCNDPNKAKNSQHDFTCTCDADTTIVQRDGPARCVKDECDAKPCGADQICNDPDTAAGSKRDFTCSCIKTGFNATGQAVPNCGTDECTTNPCGAGQGCQDGNLLSSGDFMCSCPFGSRRSKGAPVVKCDECVVGNVGSPCTWVGHPEVTETCSDPNPAADSLNDFVRGPQHGGAGDEVHDEDGVQQRSVRGPGVHGPNRDGDVGGLCVQLHCGVGHDEDEDDEGGEGGELRLCGRVPGEPVRGWGELRGGEEDQREHAGLHVQLRRRVRRSPEGRPCAAGVQGIRPFPVEPAGGGRAGGQHSSRGQQQQQLHPGLGLDPRRCGFPCRLRGRGLCGVEEASGCRHHERLPAGNGI